MIFIMSQFRTVGLEQTFQLLTSDASTRVVNLPNSVGFGIGLYRRIGGRAHRNSLCIWWQFYRRSSGLRTIVLRKCDADSGCRQSYVDQGNISDFKSDQRVRVCVRNPGVRRAYDISSDSLYVVWISPSSYVTVNSQIVSGSGNVVYAVNSGMGWSAPITIDSFLLRHY